MSTPVTVANCVVASGATLSEVFAMKGRVEAVIFPIHAAGSVSLLVGTRVESGNHFPLINPASGTLGTQFAVSSGPVALRFGEIAQPFPFGRLQFSAAQTDNRTLQIIHARF